MRVSISGKSITKLAGCSEEEDEMTNETITITLRTFQEVNPSVICIGQVHWSQKCVLIYSLYFFVEEERAS